MADVPDLFDVTATDLKTGAVRILASGKTKDNAEAISKMAVMRRGVETEFYSVIPTGTESEHNG